MREYKFRAWVDGKMYQNVGVVGNIVVIEYESDEAHDDVNLEPTYYGVRDETIKIMQYTGLKDKNGVEIYEEDNVRYPHIQSFKDVWQVKFHNGSFVIKQGNILICIRDLAYKSNLEVIGNIYENPELLGG